MIVQSWRAVQALLIPFVYFWVPPRGEGGTSIQANGYEWIHAMIPHRCVNGVSDLEFLVARDQKQWDDFGPWLDHHNHLFRLNQELRLIQDFRYNVPYFDQIHSNTEAMDIIVRRADQGAFFRPYKWDHMMSQDAESFGFPSSQWYNFVRFNGRLEREISPDQELRECGFPEKMCATLEPVHGGAQTRGLIAKWRDEKYAEAILLELEARVGGAYSVRLEAGECTNPNVERFLADYKNENILVRPLHEQEIQWSVQYESGQDGAIRRYGLHRKFYTKGKQGQNLKAGSRMGFDTLPGVPDSHLKQGILWADRLARKLYTRKQGPCSMGIVYLSVPGVEHPLLLRPNDRDDSEVVLRKLLERIHELTGVLLYGQHARLYFFEHSWNDLAQMLESELYELGKSEGCILHVPYKDVVRTQECGREVRSLLLQQVALDPETFNPALSRIKARIGAWGPGEKAP